MTTLLLLLAIAWLTLIATVIGFARIWVKDFLTWPLTPQARTIGLVIRLAAVGFTLALIIGLPLDIAL